MEGKKITKVLEFGNGYSLLKFDDGEMALVKVVAMDDFSDELSDFIGSKQFEEPTPTKREKEKKAEKEPEPEEPDESYTWDDLLKMTYKELKTLCSENELDTDPSDFEKDDEDDMLTFRKEIAEEVDIEVPEEEEKEEEEEEEKDDEEKKPEPKDDKYTWDDLEAMDFEELEELCDEQELDADPNDFDEEEEDKLRREIAEELDIKAPKPKKKNK